MLRPSFPTTSAMAAIAIAIASPRIARADDPPVPVAAPPPEPATLPSTNPAAPPVTTAPPPPAKTAEFQLSAFAGGQGSAWRGDVSGFAGLKLGFRFKDIVAPYIMLRAGYGNVDQRILELLELGVQVWAKIGSVRPYARFGIVHQHEEPWSAVKADVFGALLGVGDGIRHRGGFDGGIGVDIPFKQHKGFEFHATIEAVVTGFPDQRGPVVYAGGLAGVGFNYGL